MESGKIRKFNYKWVIVAISFLMVMICLGFCSSGNSLYITAITDALNIKRSAFSINDSCRFVATAIINMFFGTYNVALVASGILMIAMTIIMQFVLSKANKEKAAILAEEAKKAAKEATNALVANN